MKVAIIGTSGSGKTCFIAAMRWLGECGADARFISVGANGDSKKYLDDLHEKVKSGEVPPGTPEEFELEFSERYAFREDKPPIQIDFRMRDFKGGVLHDLDANSSLLQSWTQCDLLIVLLDIEKVQSSDVDLHDLSSVLIRDEMDVAQKRLAIVVAQADKGGFTKYRHPSEAAEELLDGNLPDFFSRIKTGGFKEIKCFLLASIGLKPKKDDDGKSRVPELDGRREWRPFGYEELFDWICVFQKKEMAAEFMAELWRKARPWVATLAVLAAGGVIWRGVVVQTQKNALSTYNDPNSSSDERASATWNMGTPDRIDAIEEKIKGFKSDADTLRDDELLRNLFLRITQFSTKAHISEEQGKRLGEIKSTIAGKLEENLFGQIKDAVEYENETVARKLIGKYMDDSVIAKKHLHEVKQYREWLAERQRTDAMSQIASLDIGDPKKTSCMTKKLEMIRHFKYSNEKDKEEANKAVSAMQTLMSGSFKITRINAEGVGNELKSYVLIATGVVGDKDLKQYQDDGEGIPEVETEQVKSKEPQWSCNANLSWRPGTSIRVEWRKNPWWRTNKCMASLFTNTNDWLGLLRILQPKKPMKVESGYFDPTITITCEQFPNAEEALELIERYVHPGKYWTEPQQ